MARTYLEIQNEIAQLQQAAATARRKEVTEVIGRIKTAIAAYGLTAADLGLAPAAGYRDAAGNRWSGRGRRPAWVNAALAAGKTLEQLRA